MQYVTPTMLNHGWAKNKTLKNRRNVMKKRLGILTATLLAVVLLVTSMPHFVAA